MLFPSDTIYILQLNNVCSLFTAVAFDNVEFNSLAFFQGQYTQGTALLAAGAVLVAAPVVVLYIFLQRHFIKGMLEGAVRE